MFLSSFLLAGCGNNTGDQVEQNDSSRIRTLSQIKSLFENEEWKAPDTATIPQNDFGNLIRYGRVLITNTAYYLGPKGTINRFANGLNCQNCHLEAGTKLYANSFSAVFSIYPKFRSRSGTIEHLEKRINDCMERSLNGKKLDSLSKEMRAVVAYINWVGKDVKKGISPKGNAVVDLPCLSRAADTVKGKLAFLQKCFKCHSMDGNGQLNADSSTYLYPPLWGSHSYNTAAGMYRLSRFAGFIKFNMPNLTTSFENPELTDEEAWDIAAFVNSMPRPVKKFKEDWPDITKKTFDHPFGPYSDHFSEQQHKYGPYEEIKKSYKIK